MEYFIRPCVDTYTYTNANSAISTVNNSPINKEYVITFYKYGYEGRFYIKFDFVSKYSMSWGYTDEMTRDFEYDNLLYELTNVVSDIEKLQKYKDNKLQAEQDLTIKEDKEIEYLKSVYIYREDSKFFVTDDLEKVPNNIHYEIGKLCGMQ